MSLQKAAFNSTDWSTIRKYMLRGAALGGGVAKATALLHYLNSMKQDAQQENAADDDTLFIHVKPQEKIAAAETPSMFRSGVGLGLGVLSGGAAYSLVRNVYEELMKNKLQKELDEAQQLHLQALEEEASLAAGKPRKKSLFKPGIQNAELDLKKQANAPAGTAESLAKYPTAALLLLGVASAAVANSALNKTFPTVRPAPSKAMPRRILLQQSTADPEDSAIDGSNEPDLEGILGKQASEADECDAMELLIDQIVELDKSASYSDLRDMVGALEEGRHSEMVFNLTQYGTASTIDMVKGASVGGRGAARRVLAVGLLARSPALAPSARLLAAAEYNERFPFLTKLAAYFPDEMQQGLIKLAAEIRRAQRADIGETYIPQEKQASLLEGAQDVDQSGLAELMERVLGPEPASDETGQASTLGQTAEADQGRTSIGTDGKKTDGDERLGKDVIDMMLSGGDSNKSHLV